MRKTIALLLAAMMVIAMAACGNQNSNNPANNGTTGEPKISAKVDGPRLVQVGGELYIDTKERITLLRCGVMDGEITASVAEAELPQQDDCSNFGAGYGYQYAGWYSIDVVIDGNWCRFQREIPSCSYAEETARLGQGENIKTEGFLCGGEEKAPDVETAIRLALRECEGCDVVEAAHDAADAGMWRIRLTRDGETVTAWINTDGITRSIIYGE